MRPYSVTSASAIIASIALLGALASAAVAADLQVIADMPGLTFSVDVPGRSDGKRLFFTANGNSIAFMVYPRNDPTWEPIRTPDEALRNTAAYPLKASERIVAKRWDKVQRKDGAWCVRCDVKISGSRPQDDPKANTSWHISRFVYLRDRIIIMQGCWLKDGDIDQDYRTFDQIVDTIALR
jgi:hypothetical protein